jgi:hypothetical protein
MNDLGLPSITQGEGVARDIGGSTGKSLAQGFVTVKTAGIRDLALKLQALAAKMGEPAALGNCVKEAAKHIENGYRSRVADVTGNLRKSIRTRIKSYPEDGGVIAIVGPLQTGPVGANDKQASGNHAWMVEFGTGRRRPGTQGRRTYINVHQAINGKMSRHSSANDQQFANMSKGYYFLMGSRDEPTRQARRGRGGNHDFYTDKKTGRQHPVTLHPGDEYGEMKPTNAMQNTITQEQQAVLSTLTAALKRNLERLST